MNMNIENNSRKPLKLFSLSLLVLLALLLVRIPVDAAASIKKTEYEGKGKVEVSFKTDVKYKNLKVEVKNKSGKKVKAKILDKDSDDLEFKITNYKPGKKYTFKLKGICKKGEKKYGTVSGSIKIPSSKGAVKVKDIEYDADDREVNFEFTGRVQWKSPKVTIKKGSTNYVKRIVEKDNDEIEVVVKKLKRGVTYKYKITGVRKKGSKKYGTVSGTFTP